MNKPDPEIIIALTGTGLSEPVVASIIDDAALIAESCVKGVSPDRANAAIKWLAAHLVASTNDVTAATVTSDKLGDAQQSYARATTSDGMLGTSYGQQAVALVPCLGRLGRAPASIVAL